MAGPREPKRNSNNPLISETRILLVENDATAREIITSVLRGEGYATDSVAAAGAAYTCMKSIAYAVVIADWLLPDGNGGEVADAAVSGGAKTLIITDPDLSFPDGTDRRHELVPKRFAPGALLDGVRRALSSKL